MIPESRYRAVAKSAVLTETEKTGKEYVAVEFLVTQGEMGGEVVPWSGWLTEKAAARTMSSLRAMGWRGDIRDLSGLDKEVEIDVHHEEYNGRKTAKVAFVNVPPKRVAADKAAALQARLEAQATEPVAVQDPFQDP